MGYFYFYFFTMKNKQITCYIKRGKITSTKLTCKSDLISLEEIQKQDIPIDQSETIMSFNLCTLRTLIISLKFKKKILKS